MEKLTNFLQKYIAPVAARLDQNKEVCAVKDGMVATVPVTIVGAVAVVLTNFPYLDKYAPAVDAWLDNNVGQISTATISMLTVTLLISLACGYAKQLKLDKMYAVIVSFIAFFMLADFSYTGTVTVGGETINDAVVSGVIPTSVFSSTGIFTAMVTTLVSLRIYAFVKNKNITIKMPDVVPPNVAGSFLSLIPMLVVAIVFVIIRDLFQLTSYGYFSEFVNEVFAKPLMGLGDSMWTILILILVQQILWFFGIHGSNVVRAAWEPILLMMMTANLEAYEVGQEMPYIVSKTFWDVYSAVFFFSIPLCLFLFCKSQKAKAVGKVSVVPAIFCVHEPFLFGLPIVLNSTMFIPFMIVPIIQFALVYGLAVIGIAPIPIVAVPWTTPLILSGFLASNFNIWGAITQILAIAVGVVGYYPFVKILDKQYLKEEEEQLKSREEEHAAVEV